MMQQAQMTQKTKLLALMTCAGIALASCGPDSFEPLYIEAGSQLDHTGFGNATMNNTLTQSGARDYAIALTKRFGSEVPNTVNFAFDSAILTPEAQTTLDQQADWIRQFPEVRFRVYGHTDLVGSNAYNKALGMRRAQAVVSYLATRGIARSRLEAVVSYGETQPLVYTPAPNEQNRRTVTEVSGFVENHPGLLNGKYAQVIFREYVQSASVLPITRIEGSVAGGN